MADRYFVKRPYQTRMEIGVDAELTGRFRVHDDGDVSIEIEYEAMIRQDRVVPWWAFWRPNYVLVPSKQGMFVPSANFSWFSQHECGVA